MRLDGKCLPVDGWFDRVFLPFRVGKGFERDDGWTGMVCEVVPKTPVKEKVMFHPEFVPCQFIDYEYSEMVENVRTHGQRVDARNGSCRRLVTWACNFDSTPLVSIRRTAWKNALREWEWFMSGSNQIKDLHPACHEWWKPWADEDGYVWHNYSRQFRAFRSHVGGRGYEEDQIAFLVNALRMHPNSRRNVITTWNTVDMISPKCKITNCHGTVIQVFVDELDQVTVVMYQRSCDVICGVSHNWIQYWAFMLWLANKSGRKPGSLVWIGGDVHVYDAHGEIADEIISKSDLNTIRTPQLVYKPTTEDFKADDFSLDLPYDPIITTRAAMIV